MKYRKSKWEERIGDFFEHFFCYFRTFPWHSPWNPPAPIISFNDSRPIFPKINSDKCQKKFVLGFIFHLSYISQKGKYKINGSSLSLSWHLSPISLGWERNKRRIRETRGREMGEGNVRGNLRICHSFHSRKKEL